MIQLTKFSEVPKYIYYLLKRFGQYRDFKDLGAPITDIPDTKMENLHMYSVRVGHCAVHLAHLPKDLCLMLGLCDKTLNTWLQRQHFATRQRMDAVTNWTDRIEGMLVENYMLEHGIKPHANHFAYGFFFGTLFLAIGTIITLSILLFLIPHSHVTAFLIMFYSLMVVVCAIAYWCE